MSGGFKWLELGRHQVIADDDGKILAHIVLDAPNAAKCPIYAYVDRKEIGLYLSAEFARAAVEDAMSNRRRTAAVNSGRPVADDGESWRA